MSDSFAMEVVCDDDGDCQLIIPNSELILVWEHSCMKHIEKKEWHRARQNKEVIEWQLANKEGLSLRPKELDVWRQKLKEAQIAKQKAGDAWGCNPPETKLELTSLEIGKDPQSESPITDSFISSDTKSIIVDASAKLIAECDSPNLEWMISIKKYGLEKKYSDNYVIQCNLSIPETPKGDRGDDFAVDIDIKLFCDGKLSDNATYEIEQNEKDQLRQEYLDMKKKTIPERDNLTSFLRTKHFDLDEFNHSRNVSGEKYYDILCEILDKLEDVRKSAGDVKMKINSGYRNPYKQAKVSKAKESLHIYGLAVDIALRDFNGDGKRNGDDWHLMADAAKKHGACVEPRALAPTWIHMDWRGACPGGW